MTDTIEDPKETPEEIIEEKPEVLEDTFEEILENAEKDKEVPEEKAVDTVDEEEEPAEPIVEPEEKAVVKEEEPEIPLEEITEEVIKKTKEEVKKDILKAIGLNEEEKIEVEEKGFKFAWEKRGEEAPATWKEQTEETIRYWEWQKDEQAKELEQKHSQELSEQKAKQVQINAEWDAQLDYLREENLIPQIDPKLATKLKEGKILTAQERADPGLVAQAGIFNAMFVAAKEKEALGQEPIMDIVHIFNRYYKAPEKSETIEKARKAPVSGGSVPIEGKEEEISYKEIHEAKSFEELLR